ncbi:GTP-binding protein TypA [Stereum hirsutum FP-91666 SS1]|uniref:GTP-binding protein TypA n=1 Tax=Stereum hirsutum (strain FP-91666) TaxID=721885 RepID=UPI000440B669|nr:GTP-binding protein TypA [Stereum hirsutum FP-91666 SS1]EIM88770.1 GTP-binding protein TypA [Stereum hirsutum FP-91666 SS1]
MLSSAVKSTCRKYVTKSSSLGLPSTPIPSSPFSSLSKSKSASTYSYNGCRRTLARSFASSVTRRNDVPETGLGEDGMMPPERIRNIAIIAHVDHGKTTLVDQLLRQSGTIKRLSALEQIQYTPSATTSTATKVTADSSIDDGFVTRLMDSNDLERERGITILSKCTSVNYKGNMINIVDTPGHADFGGEVERIMSMVDGVALVVDATEGPMTQTRFVLSKALKRGLKPLVVMNKADRPSARPAMVESDLFDLFAILGASDDQMEYPLLYASAKQGWATTELPANNEPPPGAITEDGGSSTAMTPLFETIMSHVPPPTHLSRTDPFSMLTVQVENDPFVGVLYLGRIHSGVVRVGDTLWALDSEGNKVGDGKVKKLYSRAGLERFELEASGAGEIVSIAGIKGGGVNVTLVASKGWDESGPQPLPTTPIDPPTISITVFPNDSPLAGTEGSKLTSQMIRERIMKESQTNVALNVLPGPSAESLELRGRGVLHLGVLLETMRREGFELSVGSPKAVMKPDPEDPSKVLEPIEECTILVREEYAGTVIQKLTMRRGEVVSYDEAEPGFVRIVIDVPARGLIGYMAGEFKNDVHGEGTINHIFKSYQPHKGEIDTGRNGALISMARGETSGYAMAPLQARGVMFIHPQTQVYPGQVIGECSKAQNITVNPCLKKELTNFRSAGADEKIVLASPRIMNLEESIAYMGDDELVEITPLHIRLRKAELDPRKALAGSKKKPGK